jgi:hypothetical protein
VTFVVATKMIFKVRVLRYSMYCDTFILGMLGCPETSVLNQLALRNNPEDGRILLMFQRHLSLPSSWRDYRQQFFLKADFLACFFFTHQMSVKYT